MRLAVLVLAAAAFADEDTRTVRFDLGRRLGDAAHPGLLVEEAPDREGRRTPAELVQLDAWAGADEQGFFLRRGIDERARLRVQGLIPGRAYDIRVARARGVEAVARTADAKGRIPLAFTFPARVDAVDVRGRFAPPHGDELRGPPPVSAWAWLIADADDGAVLWSRNADVPLPMASTTKLMTAWVVLHRRDAFGRPVVVSPRADAMGGTTASLTAGQIVPVRDLLFGLLLPSGNDAAVALAEHFGPERAFVAEMNRAARRLGLRETRYGNPHGMDTAGHYQSARDLAKLARRFLAHPEAARIVATRRRGPWDNTNVLLDHSGYDGVKTGWTPKAGGCLVARGVRGGDRLLVVVLRSAGQASRFVDARNLFRWAWSRRR